MHQPVDLRVDRRVHPGVAVSEPRDRDAAGKVEIRPARVVEQAMAFAAHPSAGEVATEDRRQGVDGRLGVADQGAGGG